MSYGLDIYIEKAITVLTAHLWVGYNNSFLGRSYRLKKNGKIRPEIYDETAQNKSSKEVFFTDKYDSIVHFDVEPSNPMISQLQKTSTVNIFFAVNLGTIYGNETRAVERAQNDIFKVLQYTSFTVVDFVDQIEAYTDVYDMDEKEQLKYNMQPYYVIRVETEIMAALGTCTPIIRAVNYGLTLSHTGNGIMFVDGVQAVDSRLSKAAGSTVTFAATPDEDNEFTSWVIDGTTYTYPTPTIDSMDGAKSALATFQLIPYYQELLRGILTDYVKIGDINKLENYGSGLNAYPAKIDSEEFKAIDLTEIPSKLFNFTLNEKTHSITDLVADFNFPNQTINNSLIATFITKYASQSVDLNNQLNILMIGNSIFGRMGIDEITSSPGESTGLFPPNMWQQLVAYGLLESLQFSGADVVYKNLMHSDWTQSGTWVASDPTTENLRLYESTTIGDLVEITITGASFFKLLFYTAGNTDIDVLINGSLPSVLGITGSDSFNGGTIAAGGFFKWANEIYSGLTPATSYTFRFTNTNGSSFQVWGCEYWSGKRINVINQGYGGYKAGNILANINQWSSEMYNADLIINELPLINDSYDYTHYLGEKFPASTAVSSSTNDFIQAAMSGVFTNYSGLTLDIGDYAQYNGAAWVKGSAYVDNIIDTYITDLTAYLEIASTINKEIIIISPHRTTSEPIRAWMCEMLKQATIIINSYGFGFIDFSMRYDILDYDIASAVSDGTHLNDVGVARWVDLLNELL